MWVAVIFILFGLFFPSWIIMLLIDHFKYGGAITDDDYTKIAIRVYLTLAVVVLFIYFVGFQPDFSNYERNG